MNLRQVVKQIPGAVSSYRWMKRLYWAASETLGFVPRKDKFVSREYWESRAIKMWDYDCGIATKDETYRQAMAEALAELQGLEWEKLLEVGCGFGRVLLGIRAVFPDRVLMGGDFSFQQLKHSGEYLARQRIGLMQFDARSLPFRNKSFDVIVTSDTLIYLHPDELPTALKELKRVCRKYLVLLEYAREHMDTQSRRQLMKEAPWYGHHYTDALERMGIQVTKACRMRAWATQPERVPQSLILGKVGV